MLTSLIIVDDFFDDPLTIRDAALKLGYPELDIATYFPGRNSGQPLFVTGLDDEIMRLVGEQLTPTPHTGHAKCRITLTGDKGRGDVHMDQSHWSGILYLSLPEHCQGGTDFFRHLPTNTERAPIYPEELDALGFKSGTDVIEKIINPDTNDPSKWERLMRVPMRFNRLILLRPWLWHAPCPGFGDSLENGRLVYLLFFNRVEAA